MGVTVLALVAVIAALSLAIMALLFRLSDLRQELSWSRRDTARWQEEAVRRGWKNPFDECLDSLNDGLGKLRTAAEALSRAGEAQKQNAARLREINVSVRSANAALQCQQRSLQQAAEALRRPVDRTAARGPGSTPETTSSVRAVLERAEADLSAGRIETDPKKLN